MTIQQRLFLVKTTKVIVVKSWPLFHFFACNEDVWGSISALKGSSPCSGASRVLRRTPLEQCPFIADFFAPPRCASPRWRRRRNGPVLPLCYAMCAIVLASSCPTKKNQEASKETWCFISSLWSLTKFCLTFLGARSQYLHITM